MIVMIGILNGIAVLSIGLFSVNIYRGFFLVPVF